jgi:hypothetical protein
MRRTLTMSPEVQRHVAALGPAFRLPLQALTAIEPQHGRARKLDHAEEGTDIGGAGGGRIEPTQSSSVVRVCSQI